MSYRLIKRILDILVIVAFMSLWLPLLGLIMVLSRLIIGSPIFFRQERAGLNGQPFKIIKFRTMRQGGGSDDERLVPWGRFLRRTSLDELPQLINVLKGEMSLVGPRPLLVEYLPLYSEEQSHRHDVLPGITGWAQVNGRNAISWEEKFQLDVWYVKNLSFTVDLKILIRTITGLTGQNGVTASAVTSPEPFRGSGAK